MKPPRSVENYLARLAVTRVWMGHAILWQQTLYLGAVKHLGALCMGAFEHQITSTAVQ